MECREIYGIFYGIWEDSKPQIPYRSLWEHIDGGFSGVLSILRNTSTGIHGIAGCCCFPGYREAGMIKEFPLSTEATTIGVSVDGVECAN
jgi:hypothetical protein